MRRGDKKEIVVKFIKENEEIIDKRERRKERIEYKKDSEKEQRTRTKNKTKRVQQRGRGKERGRTETKRQMGGDKNTQGLQDKMFSYASLQNNEQ